MLWFLPVLGYFLAVFLHALWNGSIVFVELTVPESLANSMLVVGGMLIWIVFFFFMELGLLLLLRNHAKKAEDADLAVEELKRFEKNVRKDRMRRRRSRTTV
jgi:hypothetical protein